VADSVVTSSVVGLSTSHGRVKPKDYKIGMCYFSVKHTALTSKNKRQVGSESE